MGTTDWIQFGVVLVALVSLVIQQFRLANSAKRVEKRTETKLKIYYFLKDGDKSEQGIIDNMKDIMPTKSIDEPEVRKALYEMLTDGTVRFTKMNKYKARRRKPTKSFDGEEDDD